MRSEAGTPSRIVEPLSSLARGLRTGGIDLLAYCDQLEQRFAAWEPRIHSFVVDEMRFDRLKRQARELLERYPDVKSRPPLFGVPIGVKDIFHCDGWPTRAGSSLPPRELRGPHATAVKTLQTAGGLILGKCECTEFAYFAPGPTRNPLALGHTPGGSSSGSAAAVAAGLSSLTLGTQTIGSVCRPAAYCGVVGFKPSYERISRHGLEPLAESVDHVGTFTSDVEGATLAATLLCRGWFPPLAAGGKPTLGIPEGPYLHHASDAGLEAFTAHRQLLADAGYEIKSVALMTDFEDIVERHRRIVAAQAARHHYIWFERHHELYHPKTAELILRGREISDQQLATDLEGREQLRRELGDAMYRHGIDIWLSPAAPGTAPHGLESTGDPIMNLPWSHAGVPSLSLPASVAEDGLPFGLQLVARAQADESLLAWATDIEEALT